MTEYPKSTIPYNKLAEFLVDQPAEMVTGGIISKEEFERRRRRTTARKADGSERKQFKDLESEEKFEFLYQSGQQTQRDVLQNSIRLYGVKKNDARGVNPTEILRRVCEEGLKLSKHDTETITNSGLRFIQRVESGKCIVFQLNRVDMIRKIFENIGNLKDFKNPYNANAKVVLTRNLCPEDNKIRSECLAVKELLRDHGFKDIKIRFNKLISVNGGPWHEYGWFMEHTYNEANLREELAARRQGQGSSLSHAQAGGMDQPTYAAMAKKRKPDQQHEDGVEGDGDVSSNASPTGSETNEARASGSGAKPKKQRKVKKSKH